MEFFERADMLDTKVGAGEKDDPADVARDGFEALMNGDERVVSASMKTKLQARASRLLPDKVKSALHADMTLSGTKRLARPCSFVSIHAGHDALVAVHEPLEAVAGDIGRVVLLPAPIFVSTMSARSKNSVSVGPGMSDVTVTPVSSSSLRSASAKDCTNDFEAL